MKSVSLLCQILTSDIIRRRLARLIGLRDDEIMRISKPASGDVRAPRQWYSTADLVDTDEMKLARQRLDKCLYLNVRKAVGGDEKFRVFNRNGAAYVVDGICGIHVDDLVSGGEGVNSKADVEQQGPEHFVCYKDRAQTLLHRFPFGSVDFTRNQAFCDIQLEQGMAHDSVAMSLHLYVLAWAATQCLPVLSASASLLQSTTTATSPNWSLASTQTRPGQFAQMGLCKIEWSSLLRAGRKWSRASLFL